MDDTEDLRRCRRRRKLFLCERPRGEGGDVWSQRGKEGGASRSGVEAESKRLSLQLASTSAVHCSPHISIHDVTSCNSSSFANSWNVSRSSRRQHVASESVLTAQQSSKETLLSLPSSFPG